MTLSDKQKIFTKNIGLLIAHAFANGYDLTFGEVYRTLEQQKIYFDTGRSKTMDSRHIQRLAVDFNLFVNGELKNKPVDFFALGEYWLTLHPDNVWGGDWNRNHSLTDEKFPDPYHFEMKP